MQKPHRTSISLEPLKCNTLSFGKPTEKNLIGWDNAFRGYLSVRWGLGMSLLRAIAEATYKHDKATA